MADPQLRQLARRLATLERARLQAKQPQLAYSSIDDGSLTVTQDDTTTMVIGQQYDGTSGAVVVAGPPPVAPDGLTVTPIVGGALVNWGGMFVGGAVAPSDFARVEIHVSEDPNFLPSLVGTDTATLFGSFSSPRGGSYGVMGLTAGTTYYVKLVTRSLSGKFSDPTMAADVIPMEATQPYDLASDQTYLDLRDEVMQNAADAQSYTDQAKADAISTAALDAQAKADAAEAAATAAAAADAQAKADAAAADAQAAAQAYADLQASGAEQSAIDAAALDAQTKADAAQAAAQAAAAADATAKADAAQSAATAAAAADAQAKADAAQSAAIAAAAADAQAKADAAEAAATAAAAADAQSKADAAAADAEASAKAYADLQASGAEQSAIDAAALDAQAKANAAEQAAKDAAALDAQAKADAAEAAATAAAATDAQTKANAARDAAIADANTQYGGTKSLVSGWVKTGKTTIDGGKLENDSVKTIALAARTITVDKMAIGSMDNLIQDPTFTQGLWGPSTGWSFNPGTARNGGPTLRAITNGANIGCYNNPMDAILIEQGSPDSEVPNTSFFLSAWAKTSVDHTGGIGLGVRWKLANGATIAYIVADEQSGTANTWGRYTGMVSAPSGSTSPIVSVSFYLQANGSVLGNAVVDFDFMAVNRAGTGELIVDGSIRGEQIAAKAIRADHLEVDALSAGFTLTGTLQVGDAGAANPITLTGTEGLRLPQPDGGEIHLPVDGSAASITADLTATSLNVKDDLTINGVGQVNGEVDLANGVTTPKVGPIISQEWPVQNTSLGDGSADNDRVYNGLETHHSDTSLMVTGLGFGSGIRVLTRNTGAVAIMDPTSGKAWTTNYFGWGGIARIGTSYYVMGSDNDQSAITVKRIDGSTWNQTAEYIFSSNIFYTDKQTRLVSDGIDVGIIWTVPSTGHLKIRWLKADLSGRSTTLGRTSDITLVSGMGDYNIGDAVWGDTGTGTARLWVAIRNSDVYQVMAFNTSSYARVTSEDFERAGGAQIVGMMYDNADTMSGVTAGRMISIDNTGRKWTYSRFATGSPSIQAASTFYDGDNSVYPAGTFIGGVDKSGLASGTHETLPSPVTTFAMKRRAWPVITATPPPDEKVQDATRVDKANRVGVYWNLNSGTLYRQGYLANTGGVATRVVRTVDTVPTSGTVPTQDGFATAAAAPGRMQSNALRTDGLPMTYIDGSGVARMDGLIPPGTIIMSALPTAPAGWLLCNGAVVSRTTYKTLWDALRNGGTTSPFGNGDGTTTFNLPNFSGKVPRGAPGSTLGATAGADSFNYTMPDHNHGSGTYATGDTTLNTSGNTQTVTGGSTRVTQATHNHGITGNSGIVIGSNPATAIPTVPVNLGVNFLIKT